MKRKEKKKQSMKINHYKPIQYVKQSTNTTKLTVMFRVTINAISKPYVHVSSSK